MIWVFNDSVHTVMESFQLVGAATSESADLPLIMTSSDTLAGSSDSNKFVSLLFETNPLEQRCDTRIVMTARPLEVVYDAASFFFGCLFGLMPLSLSLSLSVLMAILQVDLGWLVTVCLHSEFYWS